MNVSSRRVEALSTWEALFPGENNSGVAELWNAKNDLEMNCERIFERYSF